MAPLVSGKHNGEGCIHFVEGRKKMKQSKKSDGNKPFTPHETTAGMGDDGFETDVPSNYETSLAGTPKSLTGFEVTKSPGRLG